MSYNDEAGNIEAYFRDNFENVELEVYYENMEVPSSNEQPYVKLLIVDGAENQVSMGASTNIFRNDGFIVAEIRHLPNRGSGDAMRVADEIADILRARQFSGITTLAPTVNKLGKIGGWYQVNVLTPFRRDAIF